MKASCSTVSTVGQYGCSLWRPRLRRNQLLHLVYRSIWDRSWRPLSSAVNARCREERIRITFGQGKSLDDRGFFLRRSHSKCDLDEEQRRPLSLWTLCYQQRYIGFSTSSNEVRTRCRSHKLHGCSLERGGGCIQREGTLWRRTQCDVFLSEGSRELEVNKHVHQQWFNNVHQAPGVLLVYDLKVPPVLDPSLWTAPILYSGHINWHCKWF